MGLRLRSNAASQPWARKPSGRQGFWPGASLAWASQPYRDAPPSPPRPQPKSLAAAPLAIFKQALKPGGGEDADPLARGSANEAVRIAKAPSPPRPGT